MGTNRRVTVYLIRHGETIWNREGRCQGIADIPLTDKGHQQAEAIAHSLRNTSLSRVLASPLQRSQQTATIIAQSQGLALETHEALREWHQGDLEGLTGAELLKNHQAYFQCWFQDPAEAAPPRGESLRVRQTHAWPVIDQLREHTTEGPIAVVSHTMTLATIICAALNLDLAHVHRLKLDLASKSTLTFTPFGLFSSWVLTSLNDRNHLTGDLL
jgi:broad specificity phosphatase PhoE